MPANTSPIFTITPNVGHVKITQTAANVQSSGAGTLGTDIFKVFTSGANGSFVDRVRFNVVATAAATNSVATTLRVFISTVGSGATTASDTWCVAELSVPIISASNSTTATAYYEVVLGFTLPTGRFVHVSQHIAQTANQSWNATCFGGDY